MNVQAVALLFLVGLCGASAGASAQRKAAALEEVRALLARPSAADRARGAAIAAKQKLTDAAPLLMKVIREYQPFRAGPGDAFALEAVLDALIRSGARVGGGAAGSEIADLPPRFDHPAVILLARNPGLHQHGLLRMVDRRAGPGETTHAAAVAAVFRLLIPLKTAGLASCAFKHLDHTVDVWIARGGRTSRTDEGSGAGPTVPPRQVPEGFPAIGFYRLEAGRGGKGTVVAPGKPAIGFVRAVAGAGQPVTFPKPRTPQPTTHEVAVEALARLLGTKSRRILAMLPREVTVRYRDDEQAERDIEKIKKDTEEAYRSLLGQLREKRLLRADQAQALERKIDVQVHYPPRRRG